MLYFCSNLNVLRLICALTKLYPSIFVPNQTFVPHLYICTPLYLCPDLTTPLYLCPIVTVLLMFVPYPNCTTICKRCSTAGRKEGPEAWLIRPQASLTVQPDQADKGLTLCQVYPGTGISAPAASLLEQEDLRPVASIPNS
jgi:hypothetical protein